MHNIYLMNTDVSADFYNKWLTKLSEARQQKILQFKFQKSRNQSLCAGVLFKYVLERNKINEDDIEIDTSGYGKPYIKNKPHIHFNLSHSNEYAACVFSTEKIGIDIQHHEKDNLNIAKHFFSSLECEFINRFSTMEKRCEAFYRIWTLKESYIKSDGRGMAISLNDFSVVPNISLGEFSCLNMNFSEFMLNGYNLSICGHDDVFFRKLILLKININNDLFEEVIDV